jgi:hypothetical protein
MPPTSPQPSYTKKPVRRLRLPKMGPAKTTGFFEEYFYACLVILFGAAAILGKAGGLSGIDAVVMAAWVSCFVWIAKQVMGYFKEKAKIENGKVAAAPIKTPAENAKGAQPLPPGMKPMIGPQWPLKSGPWPTRPGLRAAPSVPAVIAGAPDVKTSSPTTPATPSNSNSNSKKPGFIYERPTLPDRKPRLPYNWPGQKGKKPKR